jgi:transketolase C-terminal domain/subunit
MKLKAYGHSLADLGCHEWQVVCLSADLTSQTEADIFRRAYSERIFSK